MRILLVSFIILMSATLAVAATINLKSGAVLNGEIVELTEDYVVIDKGKGNLYRVSLSQTDEESRATLNALPRVYRKRETPIPDQSSQIKATEAVSTSLADIPVPENGNNVNGNATTRRPHEQREELSKMHVDLFIPEGWIIQRKVGPIIDGSVITNAVIYSSPNNQAYITLLVANYPPDDVDKSIRFHTKKNGTASQKIIFQDVPCYLFDFQITTKDSRSIHNKHYHFYKKDMYYAIAFSALMKPEESYKQNFLDFEKALGSFKILD